LAAVLSAYVPQSDPFVPQSHAKILCVGSVNIDGTPEEARTLKNQTHAP
jgi:hypothetical protein